ncbi:hypothetical protein Y032_0005g2361 [Ancylostoma ceylanicum]|uniref:Low-density lipoprotein receptor domain class A n=1 Tax=Ancylostoma ceylanicum TaxID=53326 RepID=A0A016VQX2_9BILA|nr:hypothetical protein Y032_0005g2361 [Ancylostoma ceylanicum]
MKSGLGTLVFFFMAAAVVSRLFDGSPRQSVSRRSLTNRVREDDYRQPIQECPNVKGQVWKFCPTADENGVWKCIRITNICDGLTDCPDGSDEDETMCAFHSIQSEEENRMREKLRKLKEKLNLQ